jgi:hypothetical protein
MRTVTTWFQPDLAPSLEPFFFRRNHRPLRWNAGRHVFGQIVL